jgi:outer membrane protein
MDAKRTGFLRRKLLGKTISVADMVSFTGRVHNWRAIFGEHLMTIKQVLTGMAAFACLSGVAHAQSANTIYFTTGWFHFAPIDSSGPLKETSVGGSPTNISVPDSGAGLSNADTAGFTAGYFLTDHIAGEFVFGIPPKFDLTGEKSYSQYGTLGTAKQWSPTLLLKYYFMAPQSKWRPYVGIGVTRVWFSDAKITNGAFETNVLHGPTSVSTDRSWAPVFNGGLTYAFTDHWFAGFSLSFVPLHATAKLTTTAATPVGPLTVHSEAKLKLNPIVTYLNVGYRF